MRPLASLGLFSVSRPLHSSAQRNAMMSVMGMLQQ
jgi:hypothetical protein